MKFRPVIELTAAGVAVMKGEQLPPSSLADLLPRSRKAASGSAGRVKSTVRDSGADASDLDSEAASRFDRLRAARARLAKDKNLPAYVICHDSTLKLIARAVPSDQAGLEQVKGMGPYKVKLYGQVLLAALAD
jgi:ATP-dependent DNA helicase RecQ